MTDTSTISDVVRTYLGTLTPEERIRQQPDLVRFAQWAGQTTALTTLTPMQVENFQAQLETAGDSTKRLETVKRFLTWVDDKGFAGQRLAKYIKLKRVPAARRTGSAPVRQQREIQRLTREGHARLQAEYEQLVNVTRKEVAQALYEARLDRDIRENAPYDAAKNWQAQIEARIRELASILAAAEIIDEEQVVGDKVSLGCTVVVRDLTHDDEMRYTLVSANEANPRQGRISTSSPVGKALLERQAGDEIEVAAPAGTVRYRIEKIERAS